MPTLRTAVAIATLLAAPHVAKADVVLNWNRIAVETLIAQGQNPFAQARFMSIVQLAVFESVNAITHEYEPYLGTVVAPDGASVEAAAIEAAYRVLFNYFPANPSIGPAYAASLAAIPDGQAKTDGIATGGRSRKDDSPADWRRFVTAGVLPAHVDGPGGLAADTQLSGDGWGPLPLAIRHAVRRPQHPGQPGLDRPVPASSTTGDHKQPVCEGLSGGTQGRQPDQHGSAAGPG